MIGENQEILADVKKLLGIAKEYTDFDLDIMLNINSVFVTLRQIGIGPKEGFRITGYDKAWDDFVSDNEMLDSVKTYMYLKVKLAFDPPLNSTVLDSYERQISELEWRLNFMAESSVMKGDNVENE